IAIVGNIAARGNTTRYSEFNAWCDPEAHDTVLKAGLRTELIGLDVTREAVLGPQEVSRLAHSEATNARWIHDALRFYMEFHKQAEGLDGCIVNDVLPIALLLRPDALAFEEQRIVVDLSDAEQRGRTRVKPDGARVQVADWVIEAIHEALGAKQKLFHAIEEVAGPETLVTSSSSGIPPTELFSRCRRQDRCLVAHPLNPPQLIPLVELVPGARTAVASVTRAQEYLRALGRMPIVLKKPVPGYVVGRIAAAVWRECIDLVLTDVIAVDDLDRAVSLGPALGWAAAGPHLTYHLAAGDGGVTAFLQQLLASF